MALMKHSSGLKKSFWPDPFDRFFRNDFLSPWGEAIDTVPSVNISEQKDKYRVEMAVPGLKKEDFNIDIDGNIMTVSCDKSTESKEEKDNHTRREYSYSSFSRSFTLPENANINEADISARYTDGILEIDIPKKANAPQESRKKIAVK